MNRPSAIDGVTASPTASRRTPLTEAIDVAADPVGAALGLADAFDSGHRLLVVAPGAPDHAHHVAVEFVHPVIAGLPALPTEVVDAARLTAPPAGVRRGDAVLSIGVPDTVGADLAIAAGVPDAAVMAIYHLLWELVHLALDLRSRDAASGDSTGFLYPFLDGDRPVADDDSLRNALSEAAAAQRLDSTRARLAATRRNRDAVAAAADAIARAAGGGRHVHVVGNGGSATDAARMVRLLTAIGIPSTSLAADYAVVTALANDLGAEHVFARQVDAFVRRGDVLVGWSTSGTSANVVAAFERAATLGATCIGSCGYGGEVLEALDSVAIALTVDEQSVHRIQEAQADVMSAVVDGVAAAATECLAAPGATP